MAPPPASAAGSRTLRALLALLLALASVLGFAGSAALADGPNTGTVKIDEETLTSDDGPGTNPKPIGCTFAIDFYNFPSDTPTALISFENKSPGPGTYEAVSTSDLQGPRTVTFATSDGPGNVLEHRAATYTVNPTGGLTALPNGEVLLKVTVTLEGDRNFRKSKVFKLECAPPAPTTPPVTPTLVPDLAITKTGSDTATVGMAGSYTLTVRNVGTATVTEPVVVTDALPAGVTPTAATGEGFDCSIDGQRVTCTREADLAPDASTAPITIAVTFGKAAVPSVLNTARVAAVTGETVLANNEDTHSTTVTVPAQVVEEKKETVEKVETVEEKKETVEKVEAAQVPEQTVTPTVVTTPVQLPAQAPVVVGPPTGLAPQAPELPVTLLPEVGGTSGNLPVALPLRALPVPKVVGPKAVPASKAVTAKAQARALPFTGSPVEVLLPAGLVLVLAGAGALLIGSRGPRTAAR